MKLFCDQNQERPGIVLLDSPDGLRKLGQLLLNLDKEIELSADQTVCDYPDLYNLRAIVFKINDDKQGENLIYISLAKDDLVIEGTSIALGILGETLSEFDDNTPDKYHIHYDYFPGVPGLLAPTNCSLTVMCLK